MQSMPLVVRDCDNVVMCPTGNHVTFWVDFNWYSAAVGGTLPDCAVRTVCLLLSAGF
jgi:hypothetical protein